MVTAIGTKNQFGGKPMESLKNVKKGTKVGLAVFLALNIFLLVVRLITLISGNVSEFGALHLFAGLIMIVAIIVYVFVDYKKPHGNLVRWLFLFFGFYLAFKVALNFTKDNLFAPSCILMLAALIITYISGRLDKIEKNKPLLVLTGVLFVIYWALKNFVSYSDGFVFHRFIGSFGNIFQLGAISFAYIARYEEHKAAGREDR